MLIIAHANNDTVKPRNLRHRLAHIPMAAPEAFHLPRKLRELLQRRVLLEHAPRRLACRFHRLDVGHLLYAQYRKAALPDSKNSRL